ncbi:MAG: uroporphyrinogen decarboxylase family protein [Chloroflexota bacterium]
MPLDDAAVSALGSDFARLGYLRPPAAPGSTETVDELGVAWTWDGPSPAPIRHPLEGRPAQDVQRLPRPSWPDLVQVPGPWLAGPSDVAGGVGERPLAVLDAPGPGVLETAFAVRGTWAFLEDLAFDPRAAAAMLDWSLETVVDAYDQLLDALPRPPDVVLVADDYARSRGMLLSPPDFRDVVWPRLASLVALLRARSGAAIALHSCGAVGPILDDLARLEPDVVDLDADADGLGLAAVRRALGSSVALHGWVDLGSLGRAAVHGDAPRLAALLARLAASAPAVSAPADAIDDPGELRDVVAGSALLASLNAEAAGWADGLRAGEIPAAVLARAVEAAGHARPPAACAAPAAISRSARVVPSLPPRARAWSRAALKEESTWR